MEGIDLGAPVTYKHASLRFFEKEEHHVSRYCMENVLLLVYEGVLRFFEDGVQKEVAAGEYYIQKKNCYQAGELASDAPKYLYVHFDGEWTEGENALSCSGRFDAPLLWELMESIDAASHQHRMLIEKQYLFFSLLLALKDEHKKSSFAQRLSDYINKNIESVSSLDDICKEFHYSKNYIIRIFKREFGTSPIKYINSVKIARAKRLLESTSMPIGEISVSCGYSDYPYFYKCFVKDTGLSPAEWRKRIHLDPLYR